MVSETKVYCASIILNHMQFMYDNIDSGNFVISVFLDFKKRSIQLITKFYCQNSIFMELEEFHMNLLNHILAKEMK